MSVVFGLTRCRRTFLGLENPLWTSARAIQVLVNSRRSSLCHFRTFGTDTQRSRNAYIPDSPNHLRQIILPNTWKGRIAAEQAKQHWVETFKALTGKGPPPTAPGNIGPLLLHIDDRPTFVKSEFYLNGITFTRDDESGQRLWRIANPVPWFQKPRWIRWTTYALVGLYVSLALFWITHRERVPITGRRQFHCVQLPSPLRKEAGQPLTIDEKAKEFLIPVDDPRALRAQSVLDRILSASGLDHLQWHLVLLNNPGKSDRLSGVSLLEIPTCHY